MKEWFDGLQPRERVFVSVLGVFMIVFFFYMFLLDPLFKNAQDYREKAERAEQDLAWMQQVVKTLPAQAGSRNAPRSGQSLNVLVDQTRGRFKLVAKNTQSVSQNQLRVRLEDASFDSVVQWLGLLRSEHGIAIDVANVSQTEERGTADATLTLSRSE